MNSTFTGIFEAVRSPGSEQQKHYFALVVYAPPEVSEGLDDIRRRYDPAFKDKIPPHITIKRPAVLENPALLPAMSGAVKDACREIAPFRVELDGYNVFRRPGRNVVFLKVKDEQPFCNLHMTVVKALDSVLPGAALDQFEGSVYHPHLTIGNALDDLELSVMEYELGNNNYRLNFSYTLSEIALLSQPPGKPWETTGVFEFGRK